MDLVISRDMVEMLNRQYGYKGWQILQSSNTKLKAFVGLDAQYSVQDCNSYCRGGRNQLWHYFDESRMSVNTSPSKSPVVIPLEALQTPKELLAMERLKPWKT
jgi:hypothetical protein